MGETLCIRGRMHNGTCTACVRDLVHQGKDASIQAWQVEANGEGVRDLVHQGKDAPVG